MKHCYISLILPGVQGVYFCSRYTSYKTKATPQLIPL